jgi:uncharacterized membrane protein HdeD (DUF308 family)
MSTAHAHGAPTVGVADTVLLTSLAENWWVLLLRGIAALIFGVLAFVSPGVTILSLTFLWGVYAVADGGLALWAAVAPRAESGSRWWLALTGIAGIAAGVLTFFWPGMTALILLLFIASWAIVTGAFQIAGAIQLRKEIDNEWMLALNGLLSIAFGVILLARPDAGALGVVWIIGAYAIIGGITWIALAFRLRGFKRA